MACRELTPGPAALDGGRRVHVVAGEDQRPVDLADVGQRADGHHGARAVPHLELPCRSTWLRNLASAWTITCQVRPKRLKSLTYSEPK